MVCAFTAAGFDAVDVHMCDILSAGTSLQDFRGLAVCGGFAYARCWKGWAQSALLNQAGRTEFVEFLERSDTSVVAVCDGCRFNGELREILPGAQDWPDLKLNRREPFEARWL